MNKPCEIQFVDEEVKRAYEEVEDAPLKEHLDRALCDIEDNPFCGIQIPKRLIPKEYVRKYEADNLWKYNLPGAWRLIYSIRGGEAVVIVILLEWMDHKTYERRFNY